MKHYLNARYSKMASPEKKLEDIENPNNSVTFCSGFSNGYSLKHCNQTNGNVHIANYDEGIIKHIKWIRVREVYGL